MRVLFVTAFYPPCAYGWGYMYICEQAANGLFARGHEVEVLTSECCDGPELHPYPVHRLLKIEPDWTARFPAVWQFFIGRRRREARAVQQLHQRVTAFQPDVLFIWHAHGLSRVMLQEAEAFPKVVAAYYLANYLPELPDEYIRYWTSAPQAALARLVKRPLSKAALAQLTGEGKPVRLEYKNAICVSSYVRDRLVSQGLIPDDAVVIRNGVDVERFAGASRAPLTGKAPLRALVAGRVAPEKGIHVVLEALGHLKKTYSLDGIRLTILGDGPAAYRARLEMLVHEHKLEETVSFAPPVDASSMPAVLAQHNLLFLPSQWQEPLANIMLEAMASGLLVISTTTGGSMEALTHGQTGLAFEPGDAHALAEQIREVLTNPSWAEQLAQQGRRLVAEQFDSQTTVAQIEAYLLDKIQASNTAEAHVQLDPYETHTQK